MGLGQSGANATLRPVYIVAIDVEVAVGVDIGGIIGIVAGRPQPPPRSRTTGTPENFLDVSAL